MVVFGNDWDSVLAGEFDKPYYLALRSFLKKEYKTQVIYPGMYDIFNALKTTSYQNVKVVILGQDPYHGPGQAHGMCFSVKKGIQPPPSLKNIFKEMMDDVNIPMPAHGQLTHWAEQGVLLLNTVLTVREGQPNSHKGKGWEEFTDRVIETINQKETPVIFMLWGANARAKSALITNTHHILLQAAHPSPLSAHNGFFGCKHFSKANELLSKSGQTPIDWRVL